MRGSSGILIGLLLVSGAAPAQADRVAARPGTAQAPTRAVRAVMRSLGPEVQRCSDRVAPVPGRGTRRRVRLRVWLLPNGQWSLEVPELEARNDATIPQPERRALIRLHGCLNLAVARTVGPLARAFRGRRRQKVERAYRVTIPGPPPTAAALVRRVRRRRAQLVACVPGGELRNANTELVVRASLGTDGVIALRGLAVPSSVPFEAAVRCVAAELAALDHPRVTAERTFEAVLRYHFDEASEL